MIEKLVPAMSPVAAPAGRTRAALLRLCALTLLAASVAGPAAGTSAADDGTEGSEECSCGAADDEPVASSHAGRFDWEDVPEWMRVVHVPGDFTTVQAAVDAAEAGEADAIVIGPGTFEENVVVSDQVPPGLWIVGEDGMNLRGTGSGPALTIAAARVLLQGIDVSSEGDGILALTSSVRMRFVRVADCGGDGVRLETGVDDDADLRRADASASGFRGTLDGADYFIPRPQEWRSGGRAVEDGAVPTTYGRGLTMNTCWVGGCGGAGIRVTDSSWVEVHNVSVSSTGGPGISVADSACVSFRHTNVRGAADAGVRVEDSALCTFAALYVPRSGSDGIRADDSIDLAVVGCRVERPAGDGIVLVGCDDAEAVANVVTDTGWTGGDDECEDPGDDWSDDEDEDDSADEDEEEGDDAGDESGGDDDDDGACDAAAKGRRRAHLRPAVALVVWDCDRADVLRNVLSRLRGDGLRVRGDDARVEGNSAARLGGTAFTASGRGAHVDSNRVERARGDGVRVSGPGARVTSNVVESVRGAGVLVDAAAGGGRAVVASNRIRRPRSAGILVRRATELELTANDVDRSAQDGIAIERARGVRIEGNTAIRSRRFDLRVDDASTAVAVGANELPRLSRRARAWRAAAR